MTGGENAGDVLAAATIEFVASAGRAVDDFDGVAAALASQPDEASLLGRFRRELHRLNGSAGTFGYARAGRMCAAMEAVVRQWMDAPALDRDRRSTVVRTLAAALRSEFGHGSSAAPRAAARRLMILGVRDALAVGLTAEAAARGYVVERVALDDLEDALADGVPFGVVTMAASAPAARLAAPAVVELVEGDPRAAGAVLDEIERAAAAARAAAGTVLVVDDDPVLRTVIGVAAAQANLAVRTTADAEAFRAALRELGEGAPPAVLVVDIEVGEASGVDLVREVRAAPAFGHVPIVMLSGHDDPATRAAARAAGASDFLVKPVSVPVLAAKLAAWHARGAG